MQGIPIGPITRGLMDGVADAERQAATYRDGVNVRGIDPRTGKAVWGAQRAGLSPFGDAPGDGYPTLLMTTFRQRRAREWAALTDDAQSDVVPEKVEFDWRTSLESAAVACAEGPDGQGYFLLDTGMVQILTLSGKITATIESTVPYGYEVVDDLIIADDGSVIFACFTREETTLAKGLVRRYAREEDGRWLQSWESEFEDPVVAIGYNNGSLFVVSEPVATANGTIQDGKLARIGAPLVGPEVLWSRDGLPRPVVDLKVNDNGEAFISAPSNPRRGYQNQGFGETSVDWIPSMDPEWQTDGWAWFDAFHVNDTTTSVSDETVIDQLRDRRFDEQEFYTPDETSPQRTLKKAEALFPLAPSFSQAAFGGVGGVKFSSNAALGTDYTIEAGKDNAFTILPNGPQENGSDEAPDGTKSFVAAFAVQLQPDEMPPGTVNRGLWNQSGAAGNIAPISYATQATSTQVWSLATPPYNVPTLEGNIGTDQTGASTATNASVIAYQVAQVNNGSNEQVTIDMYVDGRLVGQQIANLSGADLTIDNAGPFEYAPTDDSVVSPSLYPVELPGAVGSWGGYRVNYNNLSRNIAPLAYGNSTPAKTRNNVLLNNDSNSSGVGFGCRYDSRASRAGPWTNRDATTGARVLASSQVGKNGLAVYTIDMGENVLMDTFSFEYKYRGEGRGFNQVHVRVTNDEQTASVESFVTLDLDENGPNEWHKDVITITPDPVDPLSEPVEGGPPVLARYVQVTTFNEPFDGISSKYSQIRQFRVLNQVVSVPLNTVAPRTYAHNFGEFISAYRQTSSMTEYRQKLEGYLAHKFGLQGQLNQPGGSGSQHPYWDVPPTGIGNTTREDSGKINYALRSPYPILAKFAGDGEVMSAFTGAGVGLGCVLHEDKVFTAGETVAASTTIDQDLAMIRRIKDEGRKFTLETKVDVVTNEELQRARVPLQLGPTQQLYAALSTRRVGGTDIAHTLRMFDGNALAQQWSFTTQQRVRDLATAGLQVNETARLGASGSEYVLAAFSSQRDLDQQDPTVLGPSAEARKITLMGLRDTGQVSGRDAEYLAVMSSGAIKRKTAQDSWEQIGAPGSLVGRSIGFATLYGNTFIADGLDYRVYNHETGALRSFADSVKGGFPPRCELIAAYSGRLVMARGDNAFTVYQSRYGDPFDFDYGPEVQSISQAIAGTVASQGKPPEPITALIPFRDSRLYIGTTESLFVQTGDLADGGRLDQLDKSQGVAPGYAWCESSSGIYYFSARGGVNFLNAQSQISVVSYGSVQRRLEEIDITKSRIKLCYNWIDKTVHVFVLANNVGSDVEHFVFDEGLGAWHKDSFGSGFENAVTTAATQHGDGPEDRSLLIAFGDGKVRRWDQYAQDDDGKPIQSYAMVGPLISGREGIETRIQGLYAQLATDQGPVEVAIRASNSADAPGPPGTFARLEPGRGLGVGVNASAPALYVDVRGIGSAWAVHELRGEISAESDVRSTS